MHPLTARRCCASLATCVCALALVWTAVSSISRLSAQTRFRGGVDLVEADALVPGASHHIDAASPPGAPPQRTALRHVVFVVDEGNISAGGGKAAMAAAGRLLDRLGPADRIALLPIPSGPAVDFTAEHAPIRAAPDPAPTTSA